MVEKAKGLRSRKSTPLERFNLGILSKILEVPYREGSCQIEEIIQRVDANERAFYKYVQFLKDKQFLKEIDENEENIEIDITSKGRVFFKIVEMKKNNSSTRIGDRYKISREEENNKDVDKSDKDFLRDELKKMMKIK